MRTWATDAPRARQAKQSERGFAMLLVFLMASIIAISLYMEVPRVAMQTQRAKEQLLIDRGEQYKRAIFLFYKAAKRYPGDIKDLESFQNQRFLRHRYIDPMTGKDEWRLVHIQNGILTDSLINKQGQNQQQKEASTMGQFIGVQAGLAGTQGQQGGGAITMRNRNRPSDGTVVNGPPADVPPNPDPSAAANNPNNNNPGATPQPGMPGYPGQNNPNGQNVAGQPQLPPGVPGLPGTPGATNPPGSAGTIPGLPGAIAGRGVPTAGSPSSTSSGGGFLGGGSSFVGNGGSFLGGGSTVGTQPTTGGTYPGQTMPGQTMPGQTMPGQTYPGQGLPGQPGMPVSSQTGGVSPYSTQAGANGAPPGFAQPGANANAPNNSAADLIRNILTTPRPGGMPQQTMGGQVIGGGIAGVASTSDGEGVMVYNDHSLYAEWEFIFDPTKIKQIPNPNAQGLNGTPASQMGNTQGMSQPGQPVQPSPFGTQSPFGNQSPFGTQSPAGTPITPGGRQ